MKKIITFLILCLPLFSLAQGIKFEEGLTWEQIKQKAKTENKYIFVDCYATWCGPCKLMDTNVYSSKNVGELVNNSFISVKVQFDTAKGDNSDIKNWYADAHRMIEEYKVTNLPSYLFFSKDGQILHKGIGYKHANTFIELVHDATDSTKQVFKLLRDYKQGSMKYEQLPYLMNGVRQILNDRQMELIIAQDYLKNHLYKNDLNELFNKKDIEFIAKYIRSSKEKGFILFGKFDTKVDSIMNKIGFSKSVIEYVITKEDIEPAILKYELAGKRPKWKRTETEIRKKYDKGYAERTVLNYQLFWYRKTENWSELAKSHVLKIEKYGLDTAGMAKFIINNIVWEVFFEHCNNKRMLQKAADWMKIISAATNDPVDMDTYANVLYKIGRIEDAILWEENALKLEEQKSLQTNRKVNPVYSLTLEKMRKGEATWPVNK